MNKQQHLFSLIKAMTKSEKRYFKLFNSTFEGKNKTNLKLFNAIDKQTDYDEKALKEKFGNESFVKHFAVVKSNLFNTILKVLRIYHENSSNRRKINQHHENYLILFEKGQISLAKNQLDKAMKLANEYDFIEDKILVTSRYNSLHAYFEFRNNKNKDIQQIFIKPLNHLEELNDRHQYKYISHQIDFLVLQNTIRSKKTQEEISRILKLPEMQADKKPLSYRATHAKYHNLISCYVGQKDYEKAYPISKQIIEFALKSIIDKKLEPFKIINDYNNSLHIAVRVAPYNEVKQLMEAYFNELQNLKDINLADLEERIFETKYFYELEYYILNNKFEEAIKLMPTIECELPKVKDKITDFMHNHFNYNFAYLYFMYGDYSKSQQYVIKLTNSPKLKIRDDYAAAIHILKLFIHFELNHTEHLSYELKNVHALLKRKDYLFEFEKQAISLLQKLLTNPKQDDQIEIYRHYKIVFEDLENKIENRDAFEKFNILFWFDKKLKERIKKQPNKLLAEIDKSGNY